MSGKKKQRNAFYFYMLDMKEELRRQGKNVPMAQMSAIAGPKWSVSYKKNVMGTVIKISCHTYLIL